jgi:Domain of unknown function (DUF222)/HNH endonuclease
MIHAERLRPEAELARKLVMAEHQIGLWMLEASQLAAEFAQTEYWFDQGFNTPIDWLRFNCFLTEKVAGDRIVVGEQLDAMPETSEAMQEGEIGFAHLVVMARTAKAIGESFDEKALLPIARETSPGKFYFKSLHYRHSMDAKGYTREQVGLMENRHLNLATAEDGCLLINGVLDPMGGAAVRSALEPLAQKSGQHDDRVLDQRWADALVELACGGKPAHLQVTTSVETLKGLVGAAGAEMEFALPLSSTTVQRMACDCSVTRILLNQESLPVDVGRAKRIISSPAMRALKARDGHCRWPGCERPASRCHGHHVIHWANGGPTDLSNLVLLCRRHHWMVHEGDWQLVRMDDGGVMPVAPTVTFGLARGPDYY